MQGWVPRLERKLEVASETAHKDFRCFFSAEPINGAPFAKIIPESILQVCASKLSPGSPIWGRSCAANGSERNIAIRITVVSSVP